MWRASTLNYHQLKNFNIKKNNQYKVGLYSTRKTLGVNLEWPPIFPTIDIIIQLGMKYDWNVYDYNPGGGMSICLS